MMRTMNAAIQATAHCPTTTPTAHLPPSSRLIEETAATQSVHSRLKTSKLAAARGASEASSTSVEP